nr:MAG TPA: hypothetical protein [Caudoviricetes sp.]
MRSSNVSVLHSDRIHDLLKVGWNRQSLHISFISKIV